MKEDFRNYFAVILDRDSSDERINEPVLLAKQLNCRHLSTTKLSQDGRIVICFHRGLADPQVVDDMFSEYKDN